jgi:hypothetical protein
MPVILAAWEAEIGRIAIQGKLRQKSLQDPHHNGKKPGMVACAC